MRVKLTRRQALKGLTALGAGAFVLGFYTWRWEPHWLEFTYPPLPVSGLPEGLEGRTLAQISDLHVGPEVDEDYIIQSFRRVQEHAPDFVIFTGDWITYRGPQGLEQLRRVMAHAPHGRLGTAGILGNHDYGFRWKMVEVAEEIVTITREAGVNLLRNEALRIAGLQFIGLDDLWSPFFDPKGILDARGRDAASIVLCHNPDAADRLVWEGYQGWILAGHTHGGQCKPPFLPPPLLPVSNRRYVAGKIGLSGNRQMYISRGVGHLLRVRFNVRPEIPIFRLSRAA